MEVEVINIGKIIKRGQTGFACLALFFVPKCKGLDFRLGEGVKRMEDKKSKNYNFILTDRKYKSIINSYITY